MESADARSRGIELFRAQALHHATMRQHGTVLLSRPVSFATLTVFFVAIAIVVVAFLFVFGFAHKVHVNGVILPRQGVIRAVATQAGLISERRAQEGQAVKAGDVLFVLTNERASAAGDAKTISRLLEGRRSSLAHEEVEQQRQSVQRIEAVGHRVESLTSEGKRIEEQIALQTKRVQLAEESAKRYNDLQSANFVSPAQVQDRLADLIDQRQRLGDLERSRESVARDLQTARADMRDLAVQRKRDQAASERSAAAIEQELVENEAKRETLVRAPQDGTVTATTADVGQTASAGQSLTTILPPSSPLEAELYASSRSIGFVKPGMEVLLRYQAYPFQKFGQHHGRVREVSSIPLRADELGLPGAGASAGGAAEPLYRIRVTLDSQFVRTYGNAQPLKPGMALEATIVLERRKIYEWILEPLYSVAGRV